VLALAAPLAHEATRLLSLLDQYLGTLGLGFAMVLDLISSSDSDDV
jgi:hypothetical protein